MRSMTGFGQGSATSERLRATVTLRGVNHRYLDLILRLKDEYHEAEPTLRELLGAQLARGRVEAIVEIEPLAAPSAEIVLNEELAETLRGVQRRLVDQGLIHGGLSFADLLRLPEVVQLRLREAGEWTDEDQETLTRAASQALEQLMKARETEGAKLRLSFVPRLDALGKMVEQLGKRRASVAGEIFASLSRRIAELLEGEITGSLGEDRLAQEVAYLVDRSDVSEELDRLASHLEHFRDVMDGDGSVGKRLDFLTQEIFRELNTLGSKCRDSEMIRLVLDGKVLCEQIREQVQNVE